jgi:hypothetical protein
MLMEHDLFGKPVSTFPDHALRRRGKRRTGIGADAIYHGTEAVRALWREVFA